MDDEQIENRGGTKEDIEAYAKSNGADLTKEDFTPIKDTKMEDEINYLSAKIIELKEELHYYEREANRAEDQYIRMHNNGMTVKCNTEIEILNNILAVMTSHVLA